MLVWALLAILGSIGLWGVYNMVALTLRLKPLKFDLSPLDPDRFGGLGFLGDFSIKGTMMYSTGALMVPIIIEIVASGQRSALSNALGLALPISFSLSVLLSFLWPIFNINTLAVNSKGSLLSNASNQYRNALSSYQGNESSEKALQLLVYQGLFNEIEHMSEWPWDIRIILKLALSAVLPILISFSESFVRDFLVISGG